MLAHIKRGSAIGLVVATCLAGMLYPATPGVAGVAEDALQRKVRAELQTFIDWLAANEVRGFVGEFGWPDDFAGEAAQWNALAQAWYELADRAGLPGVVWATGEWWSPDYPLAVYENSSYPAGGSVDTPNTQAPVFEAHLSTPGYQRGINVSTGTFCEGHGLEPTSTFSNRTPGTYGECYQFDGQGTFDFLASRGIDTVKIEFRWEHVQRRLGGKLHDKSMSRLTAVVNRARSAGLDVILSMHNFGAYWLWDGQKGVRRPIGSRYVPIRDYADVWKRLSRRFESFAGVSYAIMSEPVGLRKKDGRSPAEVWEKASQAALGAIRATGDTSPILVNGYKWSSLAGWSLRHPDAWIVDPADNFFYTAHHYWDRDASGAYDYSYADEVTYAQQQGY
ncbi:MAG: cellulase family glycosylhydrolase [Actinomycetota bacterium]